MNVVRIDTGRIVDWDTFHTVFAEALGFPGFYGRNMNGWIDCMSYLDDRDVGMSTVTVEPGTVLTLQFEDVDSFAARCPEQYAALVDAVAFVNLRRIEHCEDAVLALK